MQTFMPHSDYKFSAQDLDNKRLGKQRVEAWQIYKALRGDYNDTGAWVNHPATNMWRGYEQALVTYGMVICAEWEERGFKDTLYDDFEDEFKGFCDYVEPWWVSNELLHMTHQSNLVRKDPHHYKFNVPDNVPYIWPLDEDGHFKLGTFKKGDNLDMLKNGNIYLTSKQVAELLGVSPKTISAYKARGQMPKPDKEYGRTPLWSYDTIEKWRGEIRTPVIPIK
jgi:predicted DNA-binding transcriptional regulator AlpA